MHSTRHSLLPKRLLNHSTPRPVHSALRAATSSTAAPARALAVVFIISKTVELKESVWSNGRLGMLGRGRNQLLPRSKKHRSDQLQEVRKRMRRRMEQ